MTDEKQILALFKKNGIRSSIQRAAIYKYLLEHKTHPTVDTIYNDLVKEYPELSKTTVYNTLHSLYEKKLIQAINIEDSELRWDADTSNHLHFRCIKCQKIFDIFDEKNLTKFNDQCKKKLPQGFTLSVIQTNILGLCKNCSLAKKT